MRILNAEPNRRSESYERLTYEVTFWQRVVKPGAFPAGDGPFRSYIWQLTDTDVKEVMEWADDNVAPDQTYQIHVLEVEPNIGVSKLCLYGSSPLPDMMSA